MYLRDYYITESTDLILTGYNIMHIEVDFCFYHVERSAGTSLREVLYKYFLKIYNQDEIFYPANFGNLNLTEKDFPTLVDKFSIDFKKVKVILCHIDVGLFNIKSKFSTIIIRKPVDRLQSHYYHFRYPKSKIKIEELCTDEIFNIFNHLGETLVLRTIPTKLKSLENEQALKNYINKNFRNKIMFSNLKADFLKLKKDIEECYKKNFEYNLPKLNNNICYQKHKEVIELLNGLEMKDNYLYELFYESYDF